MLVCAVKDDIERIKMQVEYHRKIGIKHFAYIDNMSTDGTFEWLLAQPDVSLFRTDEIYNASSMNAWRKQVMDIYGYDRWYLILDSDELFIYPGIEKKPIHEYIQFLENSNITVTTSPLVDMYARGKLFSNTGTGNIYQDYCYFDTDTYSITRSIYNRLCVGGPRKRLFSDKKTIFAPLLTKHALVKATYDMIPGSHSLCPYRKNFESGVISFLLHYKFLPSDARKYAAHVVSGVYFGGSAEYKRYMSVLKDNPDVSFYYEGSQKLNSSMDLLKINITDKIFFDKFLEPD
jgi:hypothetical protein